MMKWIKQAFFGGSRICSRRWTLQNSTWQHLTAHAPGLMAIRKERRKEQRYRARNSFTGAFTIVILCFSLLLAPCFFPSSFIDHYFSALQWFTFNEDQKAFVTVSEVMGSTATIIGLSFVVIGFLFDIVRDKTQRTLEELFRATSLYYVFAISVISIMSLVIVNCFKYSVSPYTARNFAVFSSLVLLIDAGAIAFLFYQLLRFFNPERVAEIGSRQMLDMARFRMLDDRFSKASVQIYQQRLEAYGFEEKYRYAAFLSKGKPALVSLNLGNSRDVNLIDVYFPLLRFLMKRFKKRSEEPGFTGLGFGGLIRANEGILSLAHGTKISRWENLGLGFAYLTSSPTRDADDFDLMKEQLEKRLLQASADGDLDGMKLALDDIEKLYDIFYQSIA